MTCFNQVQHENDTIFIFDGLLLCHEEALPIWTLNTLDNYTNGVEILIHGTEVSIKHMGAIGEDLTINITVEVKGKVKKVCFLGSLCNVLKH